MIKHASKMRVPFDQISSSKLKLAKGYDQGNKGYLTDAELSALYGDQAPLSPKVSPATLAEALGLLEVAPAFRPSTSRRRNTTTTPRR